LDFQGFIINLPEHNSADNLRARHGEAYKWLLMVSVMIGNMATLVASTIANVAVPELSRHFHIGQDQAQWVASAFMAAMLPAHLVTPWLLARFGLQRAYIACLLAMSAAGVGCFFAPSFEVLILLRVIEGAAAGMVQPIPNIVISRTFGPGEQGKALGAYGFGAVLAPTTAPAIGGFMVEAFGWRSIFLVTLPFALLAWMLATRYLPVTSSYTQKKPFDWRGLTWITLAIACLLNGLAGFSHGSSGAFAWIFLAGALVAGAIFARDQFGKDDPLLRVLLLGRRPFLLGSVVSFIFGFGIFGLTYLLPIFLQLAIHYTPSGAGLVIVPAGIALAFAMPVGGRMADRFATRPLVSCGLLLIVVSLLLTATIGPETGYWTIVAWSILGRFGLAMLSPALVIGSTRGLERADMAQAMSLTVFVRHLGGAIGISATGIFVDWRFQAYGVSRVAQGGDPAGILSAFQESFCALAVITLFAMIAAWFMSPRRSE
jgi:MFS transporter, DHA2 family, multidrug resistance protein